MVSGEKPLEERFVKRHRDGTIWAKGTMVNGTAEGFWEWFRKDGTRMRSGHFKEGEQVGEWITYDKKGRVYKRTDMSKD